jgi:hypothetical protein
MNKEKSKKEEKEDLSVENLLGSVSFNHHFYCTNGEKYANLEELRKGLNKMNEEHFKFHVGNKHNHFANWIYDCVGDVKLAETIRPISNQKEMATKLTSRINALKKKIKGAA